MQLLLQSVIIFFGTLLVAALLALGEPAAQRIAARQLTPAAAPPQQTAWQQPTEAGRAVR